MAALSEDIFTESINVFERRIKFIMSDIDKILREKKEAETAAPKGDTPAEDITTKKKRGRSKCRCRQKRRSNSCFTSKTSSITRSNSTKNNAFYVS